MKFSTSSQSRSSRPNLSGDPLINSICFKRFCFCILHFLLPDLPARCGIEAEYWISSSLKLSGAHHIFFNYKKNLSQEGPCAKKPVKKQQQEQCGFKKSRQFCNIYSFFIQSDTKTYLKKHNNSGWKRSKKSHHRPIVGSTQSSYFESGDHRLDIELL